MPSPSNAFRTSLWATATSASILIGAAKVAAVVGVILNVINQGPSMWSGSGISWWHVILNFTVPFCVSAYSAAKNQMSRSCELERLAGVTGRGSRD